jgi:bilin biosynthesis PecF protein
MINVPTDITLDQLVFLSVESLIEAYHICPDQNIQARIIRILADLGDDLALDLLVDVVGVEVANHCQGNVRRVAARGLEQMVISTTDPEKKQKAIDKLSWALLNAEDWALRYAAAVSLGGIATKEINTILYQAMRQESDQVVKERIRMILNV